MTFWFHAAIQLNEKYVISPFFTHQPSFIEKTTHLYIMFPIRRIDGQDDGGLKPQDMWTWSWMQEVFPSAGSTLFGHTRWRPILMPCAWNAAKNSSLKVQPHLSITSAFTVICARASRVVKYQSPTKHWLLYVRMPSCLYNCSYKPGDEITIGGQDMSTESRALSYHCIRWPSKPVYHVKQNVA